MRSAMSEQLTEVCQRVYNEVQDVYCLRSRLEILKAFYEEACNVVEAVFQIPEIAKKVHAILDDNGSDIFRLYPSYGVRGYLVLRVDDKFRFVMAYLENSLGCPMSNDMFEDITLDNMSGVKSYNYRSHCAELSFFHVPENVIRLIVYREFKLVRRDPNII
jgi:hypothetical protein